MTGNAGSGKTTLAAWITKTLDLPGYGLDGIVWQPGWKKTSPEERDGRIRELIDGESWVIDGESWVIDGVSGVV